MRTAFTKALLALAMVCALPAAAQKVNLVTDVAGVLRPVNGGVGINTAGVTGCPRVTDGVWTFSVGNCGASAGVTSFNTRMGAVTLSSSDVAAALSTLTGCATSGYLYSPASSDCIPTSGSGVSSFSGDGTFATNSSSTAAVTLTLANAAAHKFWGNNTGSTAAPGYESIGSADLPTTLTPKVIQANGANAILWEDAAGVVRKAEIFPNASITDNGDAATVGSAEWAINQLGTNGGELLCHAGIYPVATSILVDWDWITIYSDSQPYWSGGISVSPGAPGGCQFEATAAISLFTVGNTTANMHGDTRHKGIKWLNLNLYGAFAATYAISDLTPTQDDDGMVVEGNLMQGFETCAISEEWDWHQIKYNSIQDNDGKGICEAGGYAGDISHNIIFDNLDTAIYLTGGFNTMVTNNIIGDVPASIVATGGQGSIMGNTLSSQTGHPAVPAVSAAANWLVYGQETGNGDSNPFFDATHGQMFISSNSTSNFQTLEALMQPSMPTSGDNYLQIGQAQSSSNAGVLDFFFAGSGNAGNNLGLALYGHNPFLRGFPSGDVSVGYTTDQGVALAVNGTAKPLVLVSANIQSTATHVSSSGILRIGASETAPCWRNNGNSADVCIYLTGSDRVAASGWDTTSGTGYYVAGNLVIPSAATGFLGTGPKVQMNDGGTHASQDLMIFDAAGDSSDSGLLLSNVCQAGGSNCPSFITPNSLTAAASGGAGPGSTFNGSAAITFDYHSFGAAGVAAANIFTAAQKFRNTTPAFFGSADQAFFDGSGDLSVVGLNTSGIVVLAGPSGDAGVASLAGNTALAALTSNTSSWIGPNLATFTSYGMQLPSTGPSGGNQVMVFGVPSSGTSQVSFTNTPTLTGTNFTGIPVSTGVSGLGTGVATFLGTPSSANLAAALTDETGSGKATFATSPTFLGTIDASGATQFKMPVASSFAAAANGELGYDTTAKNWHIWGNAVDNLAAIIPASVTVTNTHCAEWLNTAGAITLTDSGSTCGGGSANPTSYRAFAACGISAGSTTYFFGPTQTCVASQSSVYFTVAKTGTLNMVEYSTSQSAFLNQNYTFQIYDLTTSAVLTGTATTQNLNSGSAPVTFTLTGLSAAVTAGDKLQVQIVTPATVTNSTWTIAASIFIQ